MTSPPADPSPSEPPVAAARIRPRGFPALRALLMQGAALPFSVITYAAGTAVWHVSPPAATAFAALVQAALAAVFSRGLAPWWPPIQFFFPLAVAAAQTLRLPPLLFLVCFLLLLGLYWTAFRTQVPLYASGRSARKRVMRLLPAGREISFVDVGSGLGGMVLDLAGRRPESRFVGVEIAPLPWLISWLRGLHARLLGRGHGRFVRCDYRCIDFGEHDVVFAYLSPAAMPALWQKARAEMRPGTLLLSYEFAIPGVASDIVCRPSVRRPALYGWHM